MEIIDDLIYRITGLSNKGESILIKLNLGLVEETNRYNNRKNLKSVDNKSNHLWHAKDSCKNYLYVFNKHRKRFRLKAQHA